MPGKENSHDYVDYRRKRNRGRGHGRGCQSPEKGQRRETGAQGRAIQGQVGKEGQPGEESAQGREGPSARNGSRTAKDKGVREGSKTEAILELLKRRGGATVKELMKATGWQPHSVRGFISGTLGKKMGLTVTSSKTEDGGRSYSIKS
jgi:hypothetical protein